LLTFTSISAGRFHEAKECFVQALEVVKSILGGRLPNNFAITDDDVNLALHFGAFFPKRTFVHQGDDVSNAILASPDDFMLPIQVCMTVVPREESRQHWQKQLGSEHEIGEHGQRADLETIIKKPCACLTYNIGLAMHALAMKHSRAHAQQHGPKINNDHLLDGTRLFESAARLYTVSNNLAVDHGIDMPSTWNLGIYNNLGRCYEVGGAQTNANVCFDALLKSVLIVQQGNYSDASYEDLFDNAECFFQNSILRFSLKDNGFAPAA
jgi:hypothetical protein